MHARQTVAERQRTKGFMTTLVSYWKSNDTEREEISKRQIRSWYMYYILQTLNGLNLIWNDDGDGAHEKFALMIVKVLKLYISTSECRFRNFFHIEWYYQHYC